MPDRQSSYRVARLNIHPSSVPGSYEWALLAIAVTNGISRSSLVAEGHVETSAQLDTEAGIWRAIEDLAVARRG